MDNDLCIIFEKGIKPIKTAKYYYYKKPMVKELARLEISHNDIGEIERGNWRKYNPYNPYVDEKEGEQVQDLKVESLDDLFEDPIEEKATVTADNAKNKKTSIDSVFEEDAPSLPMEAEPEEEYDLQKELEAKFDELFGPIDEN